MDLTIVSILSIVAAIISFFLALTIHEFSHGLVAYVLGDMTAKNEGRLTLNPVVHIDPIGTLLLPGLLLISGSPLMFGWARPVPYNPYNLRNGAQGQFMVALAGPLSNIIMCIASAVALKFALVSLGASNLLILFLSNLLVINFVLGIFNLIPIPPLDGSKILMSVLPPRFQHVAVFLESYGTILLIGLLIINATVFPFLRIILEFGLGVITQFFDIHFPSP